ncbi:MAG TPA: VOC family protein [Woeseiaceae bacterium]|nr:VOC family protein [Woeseiaceae bacterium]
MALTFQRLTIFCHDIEKSLRVYRDVLGLRIIVDKTISGAAAGALLGLPACDIRMIMLSVEDGAQPMLGLFDISGTELETRPAGPRNLVRKQTALVLGTDDFDATLADIRAASLDLLTEPQDYISPGAGPDAPSMRYRETIFIDPDDVLVSITQVVPVTTDQD